MGFLSLYVSMLLVALWNTFSPGLLLTSDLVTYLAEIPSIFPRQLWAEEIVIRLRPYNHPYETYIGRQNTTVVWLWGSMEQDRTRRMRKRFCTTCCCWSYIPLWDDRKPAQPPRARAKEWKVQISFYRERLRLSGSVVAECCCSHTELDRRIGTNLTIFWNSFVQERWSFLESVFLKSDWVNENG